MAPQRCCPARAQFVRAFCDQHAAQFCDVDELGIVGVVALTRDGGVAQRQPVTAVGHGLEMRRHHRHGAPSRPSGGGTEPDTMRDVLGDVLAVQEPEQIAQPCESNQTFVTQGSPGDVASDEDRRT